MRALTELKRPGQELFVTGDGVETKLYCSAAYEWHQHVCENKDRTRFNKIAIQARAQMAADKEAVGFRGRN